MDKHVYPNEKLYMSQIRTGDDRWIYVPEILSEIQQIAKKEGLWNLFLPSISGLTVLEYAPLCEIMGRSPHFGAACFNCAAPDTGNMEVLHIYGTSH